MSRFFYYYLFKFLNKKDSQFPTLITFSCPHNIWPQSQLSCSFTLFSLSLPNFLSSCFSSTVLFLSPSITLFSSTLPRSPLMMVVVMDSTVSSSADPTDVHRADAAGRHHGTQVPVQLSSHPRGRQHTVRPDQPSGHHSHRQPPLRRQQVARPHWWARAVRQRCDGISQYQCDCKCDIDFIK